MKKITVLLLLISMTALAQTKGNKKIEKRFFNVENLEVLSVDLYANIIVDLEQEEGMTIEMDENLFDKIDTEVLDGRLALGQLKWIQPSQRISIKIGAPKLKRIVQDTHGTLRVVNVNNETIQITAPLGKVVLSGQTGDLRLAIENGEVDASELNAKKARVNIWGWGKARVFVEKELFTKLSEDAKLEMVNQPNKLTGDTKRFLRKKRESSNKEITWISFKIKNNSWNRNHFVVVGPKQNGGRFSYGFPMMPGLSKKERWTVGTKVYKVNKIGLRKHLVTIKAGDEGKVVKLFKKE
ncbi:DUF2807 domain-containing protein [Flavobacteriaceae bacterium S356]|uniref:DUF2807 domain-containing protein n=1 Tax=Asprobacillus argus TaxID=3076534 RepID=A0ABU3LCN3_9FLAO|nr:DUF2807 domain-containing protein [Flavobacteriaceae bacterium S356]